MAAAAMDTLKSKMIVVKNSTAEAAAAAASIVKQGFATISPKSYSASLKTPLFDEAAPLMEAPATEEASSGSADDETKVSSTGHAAKLVKSTSGKFATTGAAVAAVVMKKLNSMWRWPNALANSECVEQLVAMGFTRKDIKRAIRTIGTEDLSMVVTFLCQDPVEQMLHMGFARDDIERAVLLTGTAHVSSVVAFLCHEPPPMSCAHGVASDDDDEAVKLALALSQFEAEVSACGGDLPDNSPFKAFQWWDNSSRDSPAIAKKTPVHLRPSVGTWMLQHPRPSNARSASVEQSRSTHPRSVSV